MGRASLLLVTTLIASTLVLVSPATATTGYTAVQSGDWNDPATWGGTVPVFSAATPPITATIPDGITVTIPAGVQVIGAFNVHGAIANHGYLLVKGLVRIGELYNLATGHLYVLSGEMRIAGTFLNSGELGNIWGKVEIAEHTSNYGSWRNDGDMLAESQYQHFSNYGRLVNVGHFDIQSWAQIDNLGGTIVNDDPAALLEVGGIVHNSGYAGKTGVIENHGWIWVHYDSDHEGVLANFGEGAALIDNYGLIDVNNGVGNGTSADHVIHNRSGGLIAIRSGLTIYDGRLVNDQGGLVDVIAPAGRITNQSIIENDGELNNYNVVDNTAGDIRIYCHGVINGNAVLGNPPRDWCDSTPPWFTYLPSAMTAEATGPSGAVVNYHVEVKDDKDPAAVLVCQPPSGATFALGTTTVTCTATDYVGNSTSASFTVTVVDTTPPHIQVLGGASVVVVQHNQYVDAGATAFDLVDGDLTSAIVVSNPVNVDVSGTYTVRYDVSDAAHNAASATRTVVVITPVAAVDQLIAYVRGLAVTASTRDELLRSLERVSSLLHAGRPSDGACRLMDVFVDTVGRDAANGALTTADAAYLLARATEIKIGLGCR